MKHLVETSTEKNWISIHLKDILIGCDREVSIPIVIHNIQSTKRKFNVSVSMNFQQKDQMIEWRVVLNTGKDHEYFISPESQDPVKESLDIDEKKDREVALTLYTPKGGSKGDRLNVGIRVESADGIHSFSGSFSITLIPVIIALKTTVGHEVEVARDLYTRSQKDKDERAKGTRDVINEVLSIMSPKEVKGYIFVETMHPDRVGFIAKGIRSFKGEVKGDISVDEITHYLTPKPAITGLELGALVELVDGPFKGERAKITSIDKVKEEVTVQLVESMVPIPVTVKAEAIRMLEKS